MNADDLQRFAEDLRRYANVPADVEIDLHRDGLHVLRISNVDFFFCADGTGYDGWGMPTEPTESR